MAQQDTILFLGGTLHGLRKAFDRRWQTDREHIYIKLPKPQLRFSRDEPPVLDEQYAPERYRHTFFGALDTEFMVLVGVDPMRALSSYLRGEPFEH